MYHFKSTVQTSPVCILILFSTSASAYLYIQCSSICTVSVCVGICTRAFAQGKCIFHFLAIYFTILVIVGVLCLWNYPTFNHAFVAVYLTGAPNESITLLTSITSGAVQYTELDLV